MSRKWVPEDLAALLSAFDEGASVKSLSEKHGVDRTTITRVLTENGRRPRSISEENYLRAKRETPARRKENTAAANAAARGRKLRRHELQSRALTKQERESHASESERSLARQLRDRGVSGIVLQQAAGIYNIDIGAAPVAIEVFGGGWHAHGRHRRRTETRYRYLLDNGWAVLVIWCMGVCPRPSIAAANYAAAYIDMVREDAGLIGEFRVIRADGKFLMKGRDRLERIAWAPDNKRHIDWPTID